MHSQKQKYQNILHLTVVSQIRLSLKSCERETSVAVKPGLKCGVRSLPCSLFDYVLQEDQTRFQTALDLLEEVEDFFITCFKTEMGTWGVSNYEQCPRKQHL